MKGFKFLLCCFLVVCAPFLCAEIQLKEKLGQSQPGSYLVLEQNKNYTFFHIRERVDHEVIIEEVSIPAEAFARQSMPWKTWFESGAPGHTCWIMSQVNLHTGIFEETFSFTHQGWIDMTASNPFLTTLLNLHFEEVTLDKRRRIGNASGPIWCPRLIVNGCIVKNTSFQAYKARWPSDGSDLARKTIEIYIPNIPEESQPESWVPAYFPYWLEVEGKIGSAKIRVVDSGLNAHSPRPELPKRSPELLGEAEITPDGLMIQLKSPLYYKEFLVFAEESEAIFRNMTLLPCTMNTEGEKVTLLISKEELNKLSDTSYLFSISPKEEPGLVVETRIPLKLQAPLL